MSFDADTIVDRRRMRRKLTLWRVFAAILAIVAIVAVVGVTATPGTNIVEQRSGAYIARVKIDGLIRNDEDRVEALDRLANSNVRAVIVHIDSPGGTTAGSEQLHDSLRQVVQRKPTVIVVDGLAASGGYIAALAADHIISQETSLVGSIGVLFQYPNVTDLLKTIGVKMEEVKSSPLKAAPNGFEPTSPEARAAVEALVKDSYGWFRGMVKDRRHLDDANLDKVADGRVFTGRQALELKLVDQLGNERTAITWLAREKNIDAKLPVRDWKLKPRFSDLSILHMAVSAVLNAVGLGSGSTELIGRLNLDGLLALWHPQSAN
ncbi:MAG TPA: signal peptide peptidase SppA [Xanthobacteraceae bacterium]|jgi:protease-4|nr:signal peptide peptidase SppA [Xanthobacteraceae bacterium]